MFEVGVHRMAPRDRDVMRRRADVDGWDAFVLPAGVVDKESFFGAVRATLPLDPPVQSGWDALDDSLWEGLYQHPSDRIVIIWPGAGGMAAGAPSDFSIALGVFDHVAKSLAEPGPTVGQPKQVAVLVEVPDSVELEPP